MAVPKVAIYGLGYKLAEEGAKIVYSKWVKGGKGLRPGNLVELVGESDSFCGLWDGVGPVAARILYRGPCIHATAEEALEYSLEEALEYRRRVGILGSYDSFRLINSDGDGISGLIVDVYNDIAVIQSSSAAIDSLLGVVAGFLARQGYNNIYEKSTQRSRLEVGLESRRRWLRGGKESTVIEEGGARFYVDVVRGQKTGFFLDQRPNRLELEKYIQPGDHVLDLFSYTGGFGIHAYIAGAKRIVFVEEDPAAASILSINLRLNNVSEYTILNNDVWKVIRGLEKQRFHVVIVDPPAFIQRGDKESVAKGRASYERIYRHAIRASREEAVLFLSSCSYFLDRDSFLDIINASLDSESADNYRILGLRGPGPDHPFTRHTQYLDYLKAAFIYVSKRREQA